MKIQKIILCMLMSSVLVGCTQFADKTPSIAPAAIEAPKPTAAAPTQVESVGGISSGGGGTLPASPIAVEDVPKIISKMKLILRLYVNSVQKYDPTEKFFSGEQNLASVLESTDIEVLKDEACKDKFGHDVDGSSYASRPGMICLSAFRIAPKLTAKEAPVQIAALIIHELSHLLGSTEEEAVQLQQYAAISLDQENFGELHDKVEGLPIDLILIRSDLQEFANELDKASLTTLKSKLQKVSESIEVLPLRLMPSIYNYIQSQYHDTLVFRLQLASYFLDFLDPSIGQTDAQKKYQRAFAGHDLLNLGQISKNLDSKDLEDNPFLSETEKRMTQLSDLQVFVKELHNFLAEQDLLVRAYAYGQPLPEMSGPWNKDNPTPWLKFVGQYSVVKEVCSKELPEVRFINGVTATINSLTSIEIFADPSNSDHAQMSLHYGDLRDSDAVFRNSDQNATRVFGDQNSVTVTHENGRRWFDQSNNFGYSKQTKTFSRDGNVYNYSSRIDLIRPKAFGAPEVFYKQCDYELKKIN